jgi:hypothetical protein
MTPVAAQRVDPGDPRATAPKPQSPSRRQTRAATAAPTHVQVFSPHTEYETPVSDVILSLAQIKRQLEGKTYLDPDDQKYYTFRKVRTVKKSGLLVADVYP